MSCSEEAVITTDAPERESVSRAEHVVEHAGQLERLILAPRLGGGVTTRDVKARTTAQAKAEKQALRLLSELEDIILDLSAQLPAGTQDYEARKLLEFSTRLRRALIGEQRDFDEAAILLVNIVDAAERLRRKFEHTALEDSTQAGHFIVEALKEVPAAEVARLLTVSDRSLAAWRSGGKVRPNERVLLVAQLLTYLLPMMTPRGVMIWFDTPQDLLNGATPRELLDQDLSGARAELVELVRGARGQLAS